MAGDGEGVHEGAGGVGRDRRLVVDCGEGVGHSICVGGYGEGGEEGCDVRVGDPALSVGDALVV